MSRGRTKSGSRYWKRVEDWNHYTKHAQEFLGTYGYLMDNMMDRNPCIITTLMDRNNAVSLLIKASFLQHSVQRYWYISDPKILSVSSRPCTYYHGLWWNINKVGRMHIRFDHVPIAKMHRLPAAMMRRMFCKFCSQGPLNICPIHLHIFFKWFILRNGKCYKVFSHLGAIFSVILRKS